MQSLRLTTFVALLAVSNALVPLAAHAPAPLRPSNVARLAPVVLVSDKAEEGAAGDAPSTSVLARRLPILTWAPKLTSPRVVGDVIAGLTVATVLIPQGMSYATVAGCVHTCVPDPPPYCRYAYQPPA